MSIFKCKMCGAALEIQNNETVAECEYCGTQQTLPKLDDEKRANMYDRANHFRRNNEFDKAMGIYEQILNEDNTDAEAYWSLVLCRYGIEYVEDPATRKRVPTVNRAQFTSIFDDDNYKSALNNADSYQKAIYEKEANAINEIQKGILAISQKEEPFDVFICYKETDNNGRRTPDSVLANDLYHQLTQEGFKVFFSRITLEDKLGTAYEPYIFAALNSAKVMVALGTKPEYFNAVWVKNEWSRYLSLIKNGAKKMLIPAYKDMDPYDLPEEFSHLQAQDMSKLGFMQDLIRGIKKIVPLDMPKVVEKETAMIGGNANVAPLLKRAFLFLEDKKWKEADEYCEKVLDLDPENAEAYLGKLMAEIGVSYRELLADCCNSFEEKDNYKKILRFGDEKLKAEVEGYIANISERKAKEIARMKEIINEQNKNSLYFGSYYQDETGKAKEKIAWLILEKKGNKALIISKYALDCQPYNKSFTDVTWEKCTLRTWLNGTFLNNAFSAEEQKKITTTNVSADKNPEHDTNSGRATKDKIFLLSINEAEKYFTNDESRRCAPTAYAKSQGAYTKEDYKTASGEAACWWWLRSPGYSQLAAALVDCAGSVSFDGNGVGINYDAVRPALWITLDS